MPYRRYGAYGRTRRRRSYTRGLGRYRQRGQLRTAGAVVSSARYYDIYADAVVIRQLTTANNVLTSGSYTDWKVQTNNDGAAFSRGPAIWKTMLPMSVGTGYGFIREQTYKLHGFHARFNFAIQPDWFPVTAPQNPATTGMSGAFAVRLILFFDTAGFGTVMPDAAPSDLLGSQASTLMDAIVQPKNMFTDATRFKIVADKRFVMKPRIAAYKRTPASDVDDFVCFGDRRLIDVVWRAPRPVLVRVNDVNNTSTSVGNLQLYCAVFQDVVEPVAFPNVFPISYTSSCRTFFSNP